MPPLEHMLAYVLGGLGGVSLLWVIALHAAARIKLRPRKRTASSFTPPISVLKPLCGVDEGLYENLVSFAQQDYPAFELVFGIEDPRDPAVRVVWRLRREHPDVRMRFVVGRSLHAAANPKVRNLLHMLDVAQHEHVLISDSNVLAAPDYLRSIAAEMEDPSVGLVSNPIVGVGERSLGAGLESFHLNTLVLGSVCLADLFEQPCVIGKSMLMRRSELSRLGGLQAVRDVLAEDYMLGRMYHAAGFRVVLCARPVLTRNVQLPVQRFCARHMRWAQLRRWVAPGLFCSEPLAYLTPWLCALWLCSRGSSHAGTALLLAALAAAVRMLSDAWLARRVAGHWPPPRIVCLAPLKDLVMLVAWLTALLKRSVRWRGHALRIGVGSRVSTVGLEPVLHGVRSRQV